MLNRNIKTGINLIKTEGGHVIETIHSPSVDPDFTRQYYAICPVCAGLNMHELGDKVNLLCIHHDHELKRMITREFSLLAGSVKQLIRKAG